MCFSASLKSEVGKETWAEATLRGSLQSLVPVAVTGSGLGGGITCSRSGKASSVPWSHGAGRCLSLHVPFCPPPSYHKSSSWVAMTCDQLSRLRTSREEPSRLPGSEVMGREGATAEPDRGSSQTSWGAVHSHPTAASTNGDKSGLGHWSLHLRTDNVNSKHSRDVWENGRKEGILSTDTQRLSTPFCIFQNHLALATWHCARCEDRRWRYSLCLHRT